ncbi:MAG: hypothetical protein U1F17_12260 [Burkholderiaceae bacterium]
MVRRRWYVLAAWLVALACSAPVAAAAADAAQGRTLYEIRCGGCHDRSVHARTVRSAKSFAQVRAWVVNWDRQTGALWRDDEIDAVTRYLNERYYRFPCPVEVCGTDRG